MTDTFTDYRDRSNFSALNGLRCLSIIAVIWHHSAGDVDARVLNLGFLGVDMFFVLSGFLITTLLLRERDRNGRISLGKFYQRRALRIFPIYYLTIAIVFLFLNFQRGETQYNNLIFSYLFYLSNWSLDHAPNLYITWSLSAEEQYYLLWPLLLVFCRRFIWAVLLLLLFLNGLINFGLFDGVFTSMYGTDRARMLPILDSTFMPILLGSGAAMLLHLKDGYGCLHRILGYRQSAFVVIVVLLLIMQYSPTDISGMPRLLIHLMMTALLVSLVINEGSFIVQILSWMPLSRVGQISYGMYLYHLLVLHIGRLGIERLGIDFPFSLFVAGLVGSIIVAELSFRFIEMPFLKLKAH